MPLVYGFLNRLIHVHAAAYQKEVVRGAADAGWTENVLGHEAYTADSSPLHRRLLVSAAMSSIRGGANNEYSQANKRIDKNSNEEARIVATAVRAYELEILTGPSTDEEGRRAELILSGEQGEPLGTVTFYDPEAKLPHDFVSRASRPLLHMRADMLPSVLALLHSDKPLFVEYTDRGGRLTTTEGSAA